MSTPLFHPSPPFDRAGLASALRRLAAQNIWVGTSSWKYEGWIGQIYTRDYYVTRGRFSQKLFEATCLRQYASVFPIVCGDFSFYQFPSKTYWERLFHSAPGDLLYAFKVPEEITVKVFPKHARYGGRAGEANPSFLDATLFEDAFLGFLEPYHRQIAVLIFEFGTFLKTVYTGPKDFLRDLDQFLNRIPHNHHYAVEIRNPEFLCRDYFDCLRNQGVAHVFNEWTRMPEIHRQMALPGALSGPFFVCRALLKRGRPYEEAVRMFSPYEKIQDPNPEARQAMRSLIGHARETARPAFIFVNNRLEGNAPETICAVVEGI